MNKHIVALVLCFIAFKSASAQTEKGSQNLGASFGINTTTYTTEGYDSKTKGTSYNISPSYSYFIADKLDIGTSLGYNYANTAIKNTASTTSKLINKGISASVFIRKYFLYDNKIGIRTGPYFTYMHDKSNTTNADAIYNSSYKSNTYRGGINLDFVYYPATNIGLAAGIADISYIHQKTEASNSSGKANSNTFNLRFMDNLSLSIFYVFGK